MCGINLHAQNSDKKLLFNILDNIEVGDDNFFTVILQLENISNDTITAKLILDKPSTIRSYSQDNLIIKINPSKKAFIPLKFSINKQQAAGNLNMNFDIVDSKTNLSLGTSTTKIKIESKKDLKIFPVQSNILYREEGDSIHYQLKVINKGNQSEKILLTNVVPDLKGGYATTNKRLEINAFEEKIITFSKYVTHEMMKIQSFQVNVSAYYDNGNFASNVFYTIENASSNRVYVDPSNVNQTWLNQSSNYIRISTRDLSSNNINYNLIAHQDFSVGLNEFSYNINGTSWQRNQDKILTDTWIKYQRNNKGVQIGSINNYDYDIPINGRGIMVYNNYNKNNNKIVIGTAQKSYNLLDDNFSSGLSNNKITFANTKFLINGKNELESTALFDQNISTTNFIVTNGYRWISTNKWNHYVKLGYGFTKFNDTNDLQNSMSITSNVSGKIGKFDIYSSNYYSSGYYPGTRKGALYLNQRLQRAFRKFSLWSSFTITNNNPKTIDPYLKNYTNANQSHALRGELGISFKIAKQFNLSFSPKINIEKSNVLDINSFTYTPIHFKSSYVNSSFSWLSNSRSHQIVLNTITGFSKIDEYGKNKPLIYGQLTWGFKNFQLNSSYQKGSMMIAELYSRSNLNQQIERFNTSLSYRKSYFNNKLNLSLSSYLSFDKNFGNIFTYGSTVEYVPVNNLTINTQINHSIYDASSLFTKQTYIQAGIQYNLPAKNKPTNVKFGTLNLFVFYDYNANGIFDEGDKVADNRIVKINDISFITDLDGKVKYKKIPYGNYLINLPGQKWFAQDLYPSINQANTTLNIPMQLTGIVKGKLKYDTPSKLAYQVSSNLFGFQLTFTNDNGKVYTIKTNDRGEYTAFLPVGNYTIKVDEDTLPQHVYIENYQNKIKVQQEKTIDLEVILLKIKNREVNIKRFGS
ncbi:carboxypeptidase-like regulatory domain-containing protein [Chishuiella sp.]|uniref:carboxypeptidase-like regulatory domain-containing protein n=1 Tax=Chishuiella sp. TaxID=1969467 RepID=UPI0028A9CC5C|nr:carboxypeptidase-like regulatory domain-containing protein [Chishuiella sp.]